MASDSMKLQDVPKDVQDLIVHSYGVRESLNNPNLELGWRNYCCVGAGSEEASTAVKAVALGLMREHPHNTWTDAYWFTCTASGTNVAKQYFKAHKKKTWSVSYKRGGDSVFYAETRSKARYQAILDLKDVGFTFAEALKQISGVMKLHD